MDGCALLFILEKWFPINFRNELNNNFELLSEKFICEFILLYKHAYTLTRTHSSDEVKEPTNELMKCNKKNTVWIILARERKFFPFSICRRVEAVEPKIFR